MTKENVVRTCWLAAALFLLCCGPLSADETPRTGIVDQAGVVDGQTKSEINAWLLELEQKTGAQLKVLTIDSLKGRDIHDFAIETAKQWRLGQKGKNNGALVVIAVKDHQWRVESGEGIEHAIPDLYCEQVASKYFLPNFRRGDYSKGIYEGTVVLAKRIAADVNVQLKGVAHVEPALERHSDGTWFSFLFIAVFFVFMIMGMLRNSARGRGYQTWGGGWIWNAMILNSLLNSGRRRGGWGGGPSWGGFGGGGFGGGGGGFGGGFGGGGGGSFGGGGAGGSW